MGKRINTCIVPESTSVIFSHLLNPAGLTISLFSTFMINNVTFISILILKCIAKKEIPFTDTPGLMKTVILVYTL